MTSSATGYAALAEDTRSVLVLALICLLIAMTFLREGSVGEVPSRVSTRRCVGYEGLGQTGGTTPPIHGGVVGVLVWALVQIWWYGSGGHVKVG